MKIEKFNFTLNRKRHIGFRFSSKLLNGHFSNGLFWFRFLGVGLSIKDTNKNILYFSDRNGYSKRIKIGRYFIKILEK